MLANMFRSDRRAGTDRVSLSLIYCAVSEGDCIWGERGGPAVMACRSSDPISYTAHQVGVSGWQSGARRRDIYNLTMPGQC